jgi:uncharacterized protein YqjF (DUF2071 family)
VTTPRRDARYDISPTEPLRVAHVDALVTRRLLINYPVAPEALVRFLPPGGSLSLYSGYAWVSACIVEMRQMRPSWLARLPSFIGIKQRYFVYRTRASVPFPDGVDRECVLILQSNFSNVLVARSASLIAGLSVSAKHIEVRERSRDVTARMVRDRQAPEYVARVHKRGVQADGAQMPASSLFRTVQEADDFLAGVAYGAEWQPSRGKLLLIPETHEPWEIEICDCETPRSAFLVSLCGQVPQADHAMLIRTVRYDYPLFGYKLKISR